MARLTMAERRALPKSDFAVPSKAPGPGSFPIPDKQHAIAAESKKRFASGSEKAAIDKKAGKKGVGPRATGNKGSDSARFRVERA